MLVHAAAGGVGTQLVQMLREVGAKVIGTASTDEKCKLAEKNGAGWVINSKTGNIVEEVMKITDGHGIDVIFDGIGKATFDQDIELAARKGILVMVGNAVSHSGEASRYCSNSKLLYSPVPSRHSISSGLGVRT